MTTPDVDAKRILDVLETSVQKPDERWLIVCSLSGLIKRRGRLYKYAEDQKLLKEGAKFGLPLFAGEVRLEHIHFHGFQHLAASRCFCTSRVQSAGIFKS